MITTRAKFICQVVHEYASYDGTKNYRNDFVPVFVGSPENKEFFAASPSGNLSLTTCKNFFEEGKEYYLDFTEAPPPEG